MKVLIIASLMEEIQLIKERFDFHLIMELYGRSVYLFNNHIYLSTTGVGVVSSAFSIGGLLSVIQPDVTLMVGTGGALPGSGLEVGDIAVASSESIPELGLLKKEGIRDFDRDYEFLPRRAYSFDHELSHRLFNVCSQIAHTGMGNFITVMGVSGDRAVSEARAKRFSAMVENMEGYALAHGAHGMGIMAGEIRGISNIGGERDKAKWNLPMAQEISQRATVRFLEQVI